MNGKNTTLRMPEHSNMYHSMPFHTIETAFPIETFLQDLVPYIVGHQHRHHSNDATESSDVSMRGDNSGAQALPLNERSEWWAGAVIAPDSYYCKRTNTLTAYGDVNRYISHLDPCQLSVRCLLQLSSEIELGSGPKRFWWPANTRFQVQHVLMSVGGF